MMISKRRMLIDASALLSTTILFTRCTAQGAASPGLISAVSVGETLVGGFIMEAPIISGLVPSILPQAVLDKLTNASGTGWLDLAQKDIDGLRLKLASGVSDTSGATILDKVEEYINLAMQDVAPILTMIATTNPEIAAAAMVIRDIALALPMLEAFINAVIPVTAKASARTASLRAKAVPSAGKPLPTPEQALADLRARTRR